LRRNLVLILTIILVVVLTTSLYYYFTVLNTGNTRTNLQSKEATQTPKPPTSFYMESMREYMRNTSRVRVYHARIYFDDLLRNNYYAFTSQGLKLYTGKDFYGIFDVMEYPGYPLRTVVFDKKETNIVLIVNVSSTGIGDYSLKLVFENSETGERLSWPLMRSTNTTIIKMDISSIGGPGEYNLYVYGWVYVISDTASLSFTIDYRLPSK
jgi:hypothetical protein